MAIMTTLSAISRLGRAHRVLLRLSLVSAVLALPAGCSPSDLLEVTDPDIVTPENLADSSSLPTVRSAAIGDFALAHSGSGAAGSGGAEGQILASGLLADEFINSETFPTRIEVDRRGPILVDNATTQDWFRTLSRSRRSAEFAAAKYREFVAAGVDTTQQPGLAEVLSLAGFTYLFFADNYCSGVPISTADPVSGALTFGSPLTTTQLLDTAINRFNQALAVATALNAALGATRTARINLASVGRGRALLTRGAAGDFAAASAAVAAVPTSFAYQLQHTENTGRENNGVFVANVISERYSVADREGNYAAGSCTAASQCVGTGPGLPFRSVVDTRTPFARSPANDVGFDGATPQLDNRRYIDRKNFVTVATGAEARLIEAEVALQAGDPVTWLARHNALRAAPPSYLAPTGGTIAALAALVDPGTAVGRQDLHFSERARWLWLTGHRLSDMRRLVRQYGRAVNTVFPSGAYFKQGFTYGPDVNFPVPVDELNNPNFTQCIDRNP